MDRVLLPALLPLTFEVVKMVEGSQMRMSEAVALNSVLKVYFRSGHAVYGRMKGEEVHHLPPHPYHLGEVHLRSLYVCVAYQLLSFSMVSWSRSPEWIGPSRTEVNEGWKGVHSEMEQSTL